MKRRVPAKRARKRVIKCGCNNPKCNTCAILRREAEERGELVDGRSAQEYGAELNNRLDLLLGDGWENEK